MTTTELLAAQIVAARSTRLAVPCDSTVAMQVTAELVHRCPFVPEVDYGTVDISWTTGPSTLELHALKRWLAGFADDVISHEEITEAIHDHLSLLPGISSVRVVTRWETAGIAVVVESDAAAMRSESAAA